MEEGGGGVDGVNYLFGRQRGERGAEEEEEEQRDRCSGN